MRTYRSISRQGFTLVELLVVMGVVVMMTGPPSPAVRAARVDDKAGASPAELVAKKLARELETRKSVELTVYTEFQPGSDFPSPDDSLSGSTEHFIEDAGRRFLEVVTPPDAAKRIHHVHYSDGSRSTDVTFSDANLDTQQYAVVRREYFGEIDAGDRMERPLPLLLLHVGRRPLHKALPSATHLGSEKVLNRACDVFLFKEVRWSFPQNHVYYLDRETAIPLKVESFKNEEARAANQPLWTWTAQSLDKVQDHYITLNSTMVSHDASNKPSSRWTTKAVSASFNKEYADSVFRPSVNPGVFVHDEFTGESYIVGAPKNPIDPNAKAAPPND